MLNFVQLQEDVLGSLLSAPGLGNVNAASYRKLRLQSEVDWSGIWMTPRNGKSGCGVLVEMPSFEVPSPNLPGPCAELVVNCAVMEEPNINMEPSGGTLLSAEEVAQLVLDTLHGLVIEGIGALYADRKAIVDAPEFEGLVAYRVVLRLMMQRPPTERVAEVAVAENGLEVTLSCATAGAEIYYTEDGTFPGESNGAAVKYAGPFTLTGTVLRVAAFKAGMVQSNVGQLTVPG
jgi:hypothetical protein